MHAVKKKQLKVNKKDKKMDIKKLDFFIVNRPLRKKYENNVKVIRKKQKKCRQSIAFLGKLC